MCTTLQPAGVDKAKAYMDSVVLFMKYGDATEVNIYSTNAHFVRVCCIRSVRYRISVILSL